MANLFLGVNDAGPHQYPMPDRHLFEFCSRDYWQSLDTEQLIKWIEAVSWYLSDPDLRWGLAHTLGDVEIDYTRSGRTFEDFEGKNFAATDLYEFLCWASQRLMWLKQGSIMQSSVPKVFEELMDSNYWEESRKNDRRLSQWLMVVGIAANCPSDTLEEIIEHNELEYALIGPCKTIGALFEEREDNEDFDEDESTYLAIFGEKECDLRKQKQLTRSSLASLLGVWPNSKRTSLVKE